MKPFALLLTAIAALITFTSAVQADNGVSFERSYVTHDWGQIHVLTSQPATPDNATPLACFAPNPYSGNYYRLFMEQLGSDRTMMALDYPGIGQSDNYPGELDMSTLADIMADSLTSMGWGPNGNGPVDLCGYHTGTMLASELAVKYPTLVRRMVLMGIPYYDAAGRQERFDRLGQVKPWPESFAAVAQDWIFAVEMRNENVSLERAFGNYLESAGAWQGKARIYGAVFQYPAEERAPLITQPTLILNPHGNLKEPSREYAEMIDGATIIELPELKYGIFDVAPDVLASHARPFLNQP
ncbi:MAG: alpha/beta hydrolase [Luminiphilus sp.]